MNLSLCRLYLELWHIFFQFLFELPVNIDDVVKPYIYFKKQNILYAVQPNSEGYWISKHWKAYWKQLTKMKTELYTYMYGITSFMFTKEIYKHLKYFIIFACFSAYHYFNSNIPFPVSFFLSFSTKKDFHLFAIYSSKKDEKT